MQPLPIFLVTLAAGVGLAVSAWSQEPAPVPAPGPVAPALPPVPEAAAPAAPVPPLGPVPAPLAVERNIYLPYEELETIFEKDGRGVFVPYREFLQLWNELTLQRAKPPEEEPPVPGVVQEASYEATVTGSGTSAALTVRGKIRVESFRKGWATVPLGQLPLNVVEARTGEASLHLGDKGYEAVLPHQGVYELELDLLAPVRQDETGWKSRLAFPRSPVSRLSLEVPGAGWTFSAGEMLPFSVSTAGEATRLEVSFGELQTLDLGWSRPSEDSRLVPLVLAEADVRSRIVPGAIQTTAKIAYRILRAGVDRFELEVPASHEVLLVEGADLEEWTITGEGERRRVTARLRGEVRDRYELQVLLERSLGALPATSDVPAVEALGVARQSGTVEVSAAPEFDVAVGPVQGLSRLVSEDAAGSGWSERYRFLKGGHALGLSVGRARPEITAESRAVVRVLPDRVEWSAVLDLEVGRVPLFEAEVALPAGFEGYRVTGEDVREHERDGDRLRVRLFRPLGRSRFRIDAFRLRPGSEEPLEAPWADVAGAQVTSGWMAVEVDPGLDATLENAGSWQVADGEAVRSGLRDAGLESADEGIGLRRAGGGPSARIAFRTRKAQVAARVSQAVRVEEERVSYRWWIDHDVLFAGTNRFVLRIPASCAEQLQVGGGGQVEIDRAYRPPGVEDAGGDVFWAVTVAGRKPGTHRLELAMERSYPPVGFEQPVSVDVPFIGTEGVFRETGQIAVVAAANLDLGEPRAEGLEAVDSRELEEPLAGEGVVRAYRYRGRPGGLSLPVRKNRYLEIPRALVTHADLNAVLSGDGALTTEAVYWLRNAAESSLRVRLPEGARMVSEVVVRDRVEPAVQPGANEMLIRIPSGAVGGSGDQPFPVRFVYEVPSPNAGLSLPKRGAMVIPAPEVSGLQILQTRNQLFLPPEFRYFSFGGPYQLAEKVKGWREARRGLDFLLPALGAESLEGIPEPRPEPPRFDPETVEGGLQTPMVKDGQRFTLHRLGPPAPVTVAFLSQGLSTALEAVLCLLALAVGLSMSRSSMEARFLFLVFAGLLPLALAGMVAPHLADVYRAVFLGAVGSIGGWLIAGIWWMVLPPASEVPALPAGPPFRPEPEPEPEAEPEAEPEPEPEPEPKAVADRPPEGAPAPEEGGATPDEKPAAG